MVSSPQKKLDIVKQSEKSDATIVDSAIRAKNTNTAVGTDRSLRRKNEIISVSMPLERRTNPAANQIFAMSFPAPEPTPAQPASSLANLG